MTGTRVIIAEKKVRRKQIRGTSNMVALTILKIQSIHSVIRFVIFARKDVTLIKNKLDKKI